MKKRSSTVVLGILTVCFFAVTAFAGPVQTKQLKGVTTNKKLLRATHPAMKGFKLPTCADPAAFAVDFRIVTRNQFRGTVEIKGTVKNVGTAAFESGPNQQAAYLYEVPLGGTPKLVATLPFQNLMVGQAVTVVFSRQWDASSPSEGEFPPNYRLMVSYDPDIYIDGNEKNNDCNNSNNSKERSGADINALFH